MVQNHERCIIPLPIWHIGRGTAYLSWFWNTLPVLDFTIFVMVACRVFCHDNKIRRTYSCSLLGTHVEVYNLAMISHDFLSKILEFRADPKISP